MDDQHTNLETKIDNTTKFLRQKSISYYKYVKQMLQSLPSSLLIYYLKSKTKTKTFSYNAPGMILSLEI